MRSKTSVLSRLSGRLIGWMTAVFHPKSIRSLFAKSFGMLFAFFAVLLLISGLYFTNITRKQVHTFMKDTLRLYNEQISQDFTEAMTFLSENSVQNTDFTSLSIASTPTEIYYHTVRVQKTLSVGNYCFANIGGLFVYSPEQNIFIRQINASHNATQSSLKCSESIKELLRTYSQQGRLNQLDLKQWILLPVEDEHFIVRIISRRSNFSGVWVSLKHLASSFTQFANMGAEMLFADDDGQCLIGTEYEGVRFNLKGTVDHPAYYRRDFAHSYLIVSDKLENSTYSIVALVPMSYITSQLAGLFGFLVFVLIWLILFSLILSVMMNRFFNTPTELLRPVIASMHSGDFNAKIEADSSYQEIRTVLDTFNEMIGEIQNLRIHLYEQQLAQKDIEKEYLRLQVAPHFLINCLNTIFVMSQDRAHSDVMQQTISTLSDHLRYSLSTQSTTSLSEEIYFVKNYLRLTQLRYPGILTYDIHVEQQAYQGRVFPHLLLMLTENAIKANLVMGEDFHVQIQGYLYRKQASEWVHLTHIDTGTGFDKASLTLYNHIMEHPEVVKNGYSIGIYNIVMRMLLTMGESATMLFSNEPGQGARIDMDFPFVPYEAEIPLGSGGTVRGGGQA